jgi:hypothetical protein
MSDMNASQFNEIWLTAMDALIQNRLAGLDYDKTIKAKIIKDCEEDVITQVRVYSADKLLWSKEGLQVEAIDYELSLKDYEFDKFVRVEVEGRNAHHVCISTPFFIK